jgi:hypothetical protein
MAVLEDAFLIPLTKVAPEKQYGEYRFSDQVRLAFASGNATEALCLSLARQEVEPVAKETV